MVLKNATVKRQWGQEFWQSNKQSQAEEETEKVNNKKEGKKAEREREREHPGMWHEKQFLVPDQKEQGTY